MHRTYYCAKLPLIQFQSSLVLVVLLCVLKTLKTHNFLIAFKSNKSYDDETVQLKIASALGENGNKFSVATLIKP